MLTLGHQMLKTTVIYTDALASWELINSATCSTLCILGSTDFKALMRPLFTEPLTEVFGGRGR